MDTEMRSNARKPWKLWIFVENVLYIIAAVILAGIVQAFVVRPFIVSGTSMDPTVTNGSYLIINEVGYRTHAPSRGDVIVFKAPPEPTKYYIKRIIGMPGDTVRINGSSVTIVDAAHPNGFVLKEPYVTHKGSDHLTITVPANNYFVMGDNRSGSYDSRAWGPLPAENVRGYAWLRLFPIQSLDYLPGEYRYGAN